MSELVVADSFLVADGKVRGLALHRERFTRTCTSLGVDADGFWDESVERLPRTDRWFPRLELTADGDLALQLRPAPPTGGRVRVSVHDGMDPRTQPRVKGPDLAVLGEIKARAAAAYGADEVLLIDEDGVVVEAAYSGLLWWEDETLCVPPPDRPVLPSVTVRLLRRIAAQQGAPVAERARKLEELAGREVWLANALHGIRPVEMLLLDPPQHLPVKRAERWQPFLLNLAEPLPPAR